MLSRSPENYQSSLWSPQGLLLVANILLAILAPFGAQAQKIKNETGQTLQQNLLTAPLQPKVQCRVEERSFYGSAIPTREGRVDTSNIRDIMYNNEEERGRLFTYLTWVHEEHVSQVQISENEFVLYEKNTAVYIHADDLTKAKLLHAPDSVGVRIDTAPSTSGPCVEVRLTVNRHEQKDIRNITDNTLLSNEIGISTAIEYIRLVTESDAAAYFWLVYSEWYIYTCTLTWEPLQKIHLDRVPGVHSGCTELDIRWYGHGDAFVTRESSSRLHDNDDIFTLFYVTPGTREAKTVTRWSTPIYKKQNETPERTIRRWSNNSLTFISKKNPQKQFRCRESENGGIYWYEDDRVYLLERPNKENDDITGFTLLHADTSRIGEIREITRTWLIIGKQWYARYHAATWKIQYPERNTYRDLHVVTDYNMYEDTPRTILSSSDGQLILFHDNIYEFETIAHIQWAAWNTYDFENDTTHQYLLFVGSVGNAEQAHYVRDQKKKALSSLDMSRTSLGVDREFNEWTYLDKSNRTIEFRQYTWDNMKIMSANEHTWNVSFDYPRNNQDVLDTRGHVIDTRRHLMLRDSTGGFIDIGEVEFFTNFHDASPKPQPKDQERGNLVKFDLVGDRCVIINQGKPPTVTFSSYNIPQLHDEPLLADTTHAELRRLGITQLQNGRSKEFWQTVVQNRVALERWDTSFLQQKPVVVVYSPQSDRNGAFMWLDYNFRNFTVLFWERKDKEDVQDATTQLKLHKISPMYVFRNGHGSGTEVQWSDTTWVDCVEMAEALNTETEHTRLRTARDHTMYGARLIMVSCSAGKSLVECLSQWTPYFYEISGPDIPTNIDIVEKVVDGVPELIYKPNEWVLITSPGRMRKKK